MKTILKYFFVIMLSAFLCSCGFKIQNGLNLPKTLSHLNFQSGDPYSGLSISIRQKLLDAGINIDQHAPITLRITNDTFTHNNPNLVSSAQATLYTFTNSVSFALYNKYGNPIIPIQSVSSEKTITLNPNEVLGANNETEFMRREMRRDIIYKMLNVLNARNTREALSKSARKTFKTRS